MTTIGSSSVQALQQRFSNSAANVEVKLKRVEVSPEIKANLAREAKEAAQQEIANKAAQIQGNTHEVTPSKPPVKSAGVENNNMVLPEVSSLSRESAAAMLDHVQYMIDNKKDVSTVVSGINGGQKTDSLEVYKSWLQSRVGVDVYA